MTVLSGTPRNTWQPAAPTPGKRASGLSSSRAARSDRRERSKARSPAKAVRQSRTPRCGQRSSPTQTFGTRSQADGSYLLIAPVGTYTVTASAFGYFPEIVTGVEVLSGTETVQDFELAVAPSHVISGVVSDANTGWPLYAKITPTGVPIDPVWSDPVTGFYSMTLPEGSSYTFLCRGFCRRLPAEIRADRDDQQDMTRNIPLEVDATTCNAPGYRPVITAGLYINFREQRWRADHQRNHLLGLGDDQQRARLGALRDESLGNQPGRQLPEQRERRSEPGAGPERLCGTEPGDHLVAVAENGKPLRLCQPGSQQGRGCFVGTRLWTGDRRRRSGLEQALRGARLELCGGGFPPALQIHLGWIGRLSRVGTWTTCW